MRNLRSFRPFRAVVPVLLIVPASLVVGTAAPSSAAVAPQVAVKVLLIGSGPGDPTTAAWQSALTSEGVAYTVATATGSAPTQSVVLPALTSGTTGSFDAVVIADSPTNFAAGQLDALGTYESSYNVRQVDGYMYPSPALGITAATGGVVDNTTAQLTAAGKAMLPELVGPIPFGTGSYGYGATVLPGASVTPILDDAAGNVTASIFQHPTTDLQSGVAELSLNFNYNASQSQWLLLAPGLISWATGGTHFGLYRNYFGEDIDDNFLADNEWSSQFQCTPAASDPPDYTCAPGVAGNPLDEPADVQMTAADVDHVVAWEKTAGITLNLAFNGVGACTAPSAAAVSSAICNGSSTINGKTSTDPGQVIDPSAPNDQGLVNELLKDKSAFNWITHTWSHQFLGCNVWQPQPLTAVTPVAGSGTSFTSGSYSYIVTAATAYGESEPSLPKSVAVTAGGSAKLTWPDAPNGVGEDGNPGPTLAQLEATFSGGTGFWGYDIYRENPGTSTYGLVGQVPENIAGGQATYSFTDTNTTSPGDAPGSTDAFPTATDPGIDCSSAPGSWDPATEPAATAPTGDNSIEQEIGLDDAFAAANNLPNFSSAAIVTGEHSGLESPNIAKAFTAEGITTFASDGSRQPQSYALGSGVDAPRYPSNIYYNASNWPDEINEYSTLYASTGTNLNNPTYPGETGHCAGNTSTTTCLTTAPTEASILESESSIMLSHVLSNNPRVGYAHQPNLMGPAQVAGKDYGYTLLTLIDDVMSQYKSVYSAPIVQMTDVTQATVLAEQSAWATALSAGKVTAINANGAITITNAGSTAVKAPFTAPAGSTVNGGAFGTPYGGELSDWITVAPGTSVTIGEHVAPTITSVATGNSIVGAPFAATVTTSGLPAPTITEVGALPAGITFVSNGDGTATIAGTATSGTGGSYPITITASNDSGTVTQAFTLVNAEAPTITSPSAATFVSGVNSTYSATTTGYPAPSITESGPLPAGLSFTDAGNGSGTITGSTTAAPGVFPVSLSATNISGSTATLPLVITVSASAPPAITSGDTAFFTLQQAGSFAVVATGSPTPVITETGALPAGLSFTDGGNGIATLAGTPTATSSTPITITATNVISGVTQAFTILVGQGPTITNSTTAKFVAGVAGSFAISTTGFPAPSLGESGTLPSGLVFTDNGDGSGTIAGTPSADGEGPYAVNLLATNGTGSTNMALVITVDGAPQITSIGAATFTAGSAGSFTVTSAGNPTAVLSESGALPSGLTFADNGDGTATIAGTPAVGTSGTSSITVGAANGIEPDASQSFVITVDAAPTFTSNSAATFQSGTAATFTVTTTGTPAPKIGISGALPAGMSLVDNGDGTATIAGTPSTSASGIYPVTLSATSTAGSATQLFTLTVAHQPTITSAATAPFVIGTPGTFTVTTAGYPVAAITRSGTVAPGLTFTDNGNGTATIAGTPAVGDGASYPVTLSASNTIAPDASQSLTITVAPSPAPQFTSAATATGTVGAPFSFSISATGTPVPTITEVGALAKGLKFTGGAGVATLAGTPTAGGVFTLALSAKNAAGTVTQNLVVTIAKAPTITSKATLAATAGTPVTFTVTTTGTPAPKITESGAMPGGISLVDNGNGTATIAGTPTATSGGSYVLTLSAQNTTGTVTQAFTISVKQGPTITSASSAPTAVGNLFLFLVTATGTPTPTISKSGALPPGVVFVGGLLLGTPLKGGVYVVTFTAKNATGSSSQTFTLTVAQRPEVRLKGAATATVGTPFSYAITTTANPTASISASGTLPKGITLHDAGDGTATLAGTPAVGSGGTYPVTITATNNQGTTTAALAVTVNEAPSITSGSSLAVKVGTPFTFTVTAKGSPSPTITRSGTLPKGVAFTSGTGSATLSGTATVKGSSVLTFTAKNKVGSTTQTFTVTAG